MSGGFDVDAEHRPFELLRRCVPDALAVYAWDEV
jgi:hypothetical protein